MKHIKNILNILFTFCLEIPMEILGFILVPIILLFIPKSWDRLPKFLSWFDDYKYGINGDGEAGVWGWKGPEHANGKERNYWWRLKWLYRNKINTFSHVVTGLDNSKIVMLQYTGNPYVSNQKPEAGFLYIEATTDSGKKYCEYYWVKQWFNSKLCIRFRFGWKMKDALERYLEEGSMDFKKMIAEDRLRSHSQFVFVPNPLTRFGRK